MNPQSIERRRLLAGAVLGTARSAGRSLVPGSAAAAALGALSPARAEPAGSPGDVSTADAWADAFTDVPESYGPVRVAFDKALPDGLRGTLYRNGPARLQRGPTQYRHWFDGDGMMHAFRLEGPTLQHQARMIRTDKYVAEERAGRFLFPAFGTAMSDAAPVARSDDLNVANTSVLPLGDELLALWEGGSPWRLDPQSLQTLGRKVWTPDTDGLAFSAHPKLDLDGTVWSFGYLAGSGKLVLYRLDRQGSLRATRLIEAPNADMVHDFAITRRWLVFVLMPLVFDRESGRGNGSFLAKYRWRPEQGGVVLLIDKNTLEIAHRIETPATAFFHIGNAWEDGDAVRVQLMRIDDFLGLMGNITDTLQRRPVRDPVHTGAVEIAADPRRRQADVRPLSPVTAEFPRVDPRYLGRRTGSLFVGSRAPSMPAPLFGLNAVARMDTDSGRLQQFDYGRETLVEEHVFVPRPGAPESQGWLLGTAWNRVTRRTTLSVFDAAAVDAGPIAQARLPYGLPLGLHGSFVGA